MQKLDVGSKIQSEGNHSAAPDLELLTKALLLAINEIELLSDRVNRLEANAGGAQTPRY